MPKNQQRLNINLNDETAQVLQTITAGKGISITEAIRQAVATYSFFEKETNAGRIVQTMNRDGSEKRDVIFL